MFEFHFTRHGWKQPPVNAVHPLLSWMSRYYVLRDPKHSKFQEVNPNFRKEPSPHIDCFFFWTALHATLSHPSVPEHLLDQTCSNG